MHHLFDLLFTLPETYPEVSGILRLIPGHQQTLKEAFTLVYHRGIFDGFVAGALFALLITPHLKRGA